MNFNYSDLKKKSVINVMDGKDLGRIVDIVFSVPEGRIVSIIVPGKKNSLFSGGELIIGFGCIERIGNDAILVKLCESGPIGPQGPQGPQGVPEGYEY